MTHPLFHSSKASKLVRDGALVVVVVVKDVDERGIVEVLVGGVIRDPHDLQRSIVLQVGMTKPLHEIVESAEGAEGTKWFFVRLDLLHLDMVIAFRFVLVTSQVLDGYRIDVRHVGWLGES